MFNISFNGVITVNRGDSFEFPVTLNLGTNLLPRYHTMDTNSVVYLGVMEPNHPFEDALIRKRYTVEDTDEKGRVIVKFKPQDTQCVLPGKYYYQIKLQVCNPNDASDYEVYTVIDKTQFFITE